jgi:hypothetical protein
MNPALWAALGGAAALLLVLTGITVALLLRGRRTEAREQAALASARADVEELRARLEELSSQLAASQEEASAVPPKDEYLITTVGARSDESSGELSQVPDRAVLSVTLGEPLVKVAAFGFGLRRALSAESRNRITFEMRREVKRARKERRRVARRARVSSARAEETAA